MSDKIMPMSEAVEGYDLFDKMKVQKGKLKATEYAICLTRGSCVRGAKVIQVRWVGGSKWKGYNGGIEKLASTMNLCKPWHMSDLLSL